MPNKENTFRKIVRGVTRSTKKENTKTTENKDKKKELSAEKQQELKKLKEKRKNITKKLSKISFLALCFATAFFITNSLLTYKEKKHKSTKEHNNTFLFPVYNKQNALSVFRFSTLRTNEEKEFKVQLNSPYISVSTTIFLAYDSQKSDLKEELYNKETEIIDKIQYIIASKNIQDINTSKQRELNLKPELINEINSLLSENKIKDIYFGQFLINQIKIKD